SPSSSSSSGPALGVNAAASRKPISPYIYGMNFTDESLAAELRLPVRRRGGNATTRYNYLYDTSNRASDWYFENIPEDNANPGALPNGSEADNFVEQDRRTGTKTIMTMPLIGWTPKSRAYAGGFSIAKYGAQQSSDPWRPDMGNGIATNGTPITGNDPLDTSVAIDPSFVTGWINHLKTRFGNAAGGGVAFYNLDNETELWSSTHRDVHPAHLGYDEIRDRTYQYAAAIKAADPTAKTLGPVSYGWTAYFYSDLDTAPGGSWWNNPQDRNAHGGVAFNDWYLQQMQAYEQTTGTRILDYFDLHYYVAAPGVTLSTAGSLSTQQLRLRSTRSLWDSSYVDESWIGEAVRLIPRMKDWVTQNYPGTKLALTEYNWGGLESLNGAIAQADVLGIFGREGLDLATLWSPPSASDPGAYAFRIFLNYDGAGNAFGDTSIQATSTDQDQLTIYAAEKTSSNTLTVVVINKSANDLTSTLTLTGFSPAASAKVYRYSSANLSAIAHPANQVVTGGGFTATYPASSITLFEIPPAVIDAKISLMMVE
ncbi:MAG: glycoside hydrolase family 44 protein, partial [Candidatus Sumerlaeaceae bacterium]|nr:glycoside hydrolase family 44 protein [Candidatus Sumerlaeaceae bacterium]